jgi:hypothetical protein
MYAISSDIARDAAWGTESTRPIQCRHHVRGLWHQEAGKKGTQPRRWGIRERFRDQALDVAVGHPAGSETQGSGCSVSRLVRSPDDLSPRRAAAFRYNPHAH